MKRYRSTFGVGNLGKGSYSYLFMLTCEAWVMCLMKIWWSFVDLLGAIALESCLCWWSYGDL